MRRPTVSALAALALIVATPRARACEPAEPGCPPRVAVFPSYTAEGGRIGTVEAPVRPPRRLEVSRFTGQPMTVVFNNPGSARGAVDPDVVLMPLPRVARFKTQAVYPRGY